MSISPLYEYTGLTRRPASTADRDRSSTCHVTEAAGYRERGASAQHRHEHWPYQLCTWLAPNSVHEAPGGAAALCSASASFRAPRTRADEPLEVDTTLRVRLAAGSLCAGSDTIYILHAKKARPKPGFFIRGKAAYYCWTCSSVRRFCARPESVALSPMGSLSPCPIGPSRRLASMPWLVR